MPRNNRSRFRTYPNGQPLVSLPGYKRRLAEFSREQRAEFEKIMKTRRRGNFSPQEWAEVEREAVELIVMKIDSKPQRDERPPLSEQIDYSQQYGGRGK